MSDDATLDSLTFALATPDDAAAVARLHAEVAAALTARHGEGPWSSAPSTRGVLAGMRKQPRFAQHWLARRAGDLVASFRLATAKPWAVLLDRAGFTPARRPLYLVGLAVRPDAQRGGVGRRCVVEMVRVARAWPADVIRLDAYDHAAGAGPFYARCGFRAAGEAEYRGVPLLYFEMTLV